MYLIVKEFVSWIYFWQSGRGNEVALIVHQARLSPIDFWFNCNYCVASASVDDIKCFVPTMAYENTEIKFSHNAQADTYNLHLCFIKGIYF